MILKEFADDSERERNIKNLMKTELRNTLKLIAMKKKATSPDTSP